MREFLEKKCQSESGNVVALRSFFDGKNNAWFINSRFINFPARAEGLISLIDDVEEAAKKKHKSTWKFDYIIYVMTRMHPKASNEGENREIAYRFG